MQFIAFLVLSLLSMGALTTAQLLCKCPLILLPVCGSNGITYKNACHLKCANKDGSLTISKDVAC
ncbi:GH10417 [Drosophila grimshawi]|uniref:GH10417 n=1 Tax=Drosophila grimshawi TaxID=7222 RepID=B4JE84_DROGR|nr:GH10417 [Drosophila grimshawi]